MTPPKRWVDGTDDERAESAARHLRRLAPAARLSARAIERIGARLDQAAESGSPRRRGWPVLAATTALAAAGLVLLAWRPWTGGRELAVAPGQSLRLSDGALGLVLAGPGSLELPRSGALSPVRLRSGRLTVRSGEGRLVVELAGGRATLEPRTLAELETWTTAPPRVAVYRGRASVEWQDFRHAMDVPAGTALTPAGAQAVDARRRTELEATEAARSDVGTEAAPRSDGAPEVQRGDVGASAAANRGAAGTLRAPSVDRERLGSTEPPAAATPARGTREATESPGAARRTSQATTTPPAITAPSTVAGSTAAPSTAAPFTVAGSTATPSTAASSNVASSNVASSNVAPSYAAPSTVAPLTAAPGPDEPRPSLALAARSPAEPRPSPAPPVRAPDEPRAPLALATRSPDEPRPSAASDAPAPLRIESTLLAQAIATLRTRHDPRAALRLVDHYRARFPAGTLGPEADRLAVEALLQLGRRADALLRLDQMPLRGASDAESLVLRGELRAAAGRCVDAIADFAALADDAADRIQERALYGHAVCAAKVGEPARARADFELYLARFPAGRFAAAAREALAR